MYELHVSQESGSHVFKNFMEISIRCQLTPETVRGQFGFIKVQLQAENWINKNLEAVFQITSVFGNTTELDKWVESCNPAEISGWGQVGFGWQR